MYISLLNVVHCLNRAKSHDIRHTLKKQEVQKNLILCTVSALDIQEQFQSTERTLLKKEFPRLEFPTPVI
jgi:hypothetical protein